MFKFKEAMKLKYLSFLLFLVGCGALLAPVTAPIVSRPVQYLPGSSFDGTITNGLTAGERKAYYSMDEGIQYLPIDVLMSLKRTDASGLRVMDELLFAHPERFGLLPNYVNPQSDIPLGITVSTDGDYVPMAGINCATCHTTMISNQDGKFFLVDGGASRFAIDRFFGEMIKGLVATLVNPEEFEAFYARYRARLAAEEVPEDTGAHRQQIATLVQKSYTESDLTHLKVKLNTLPVVDSRPTTLTSAAYPTQKQLSTKLGMYVYLAKRFIFFFEQVKYGTKVSGSLEADAGLGRSNPWSSTKKMLNDKFIHSKSSYQIEGGPVNTPFNWDLDRQHWIFYTGVTNSLVERNMAQGVALLTDFNDTTFESTVSIRKLDQVVSYAKRTAPPVWSESILGSIDTGLADKGKVLFQSKCLGCHDPHQNDTVTASAYYQYMDVGTDDAYFKGQLEKLDGKDLFKDVLTPFMAKVKTTAAKNENIYFLEPYETNRTPVVWKTPTINGFAAKPLYGVWATPPFLHNGSVPTMWDLLQPTAQRPRQFHIGGFVYDSKKLGYVEDKTLPDGFDFQVSCASCDGNDNRGHEFGTDLSDNDKWALIEFMKSYTKETTF